MGESGVFGHLLGRRKECEELDRLLLRTRSGQSGVLVVSGEPGVGKSALLGYALGSASGFQVARAAGVQSEMELPFAALQQLCGSMLDRLDRLPSPQRGALEVTVHSEYLLLTDIHIASERAIYGDLPHPTFGVAAGDGLQVVWEEVVGIARMKWLLWTGENIDAATAKEWGVVAEVVPHDRVQARALEIATKFAVKPPVYLNLQKQTLNQRLVRRIIEGVPYGMALEGQTAADQPYQG
jgi:Enoyl-CoA hydratase/isomerase/AAA ATPase domain